VQSAPSEMFSYDPLQFYEDPYPLTATSATTLPSTIMSSDKSGYCPGTATFKRSHEIGTVL
jgi:hypothetical protein